MIGSLMPKEFCCGMLLSGVIKGFRAANIMQSRCIYIALCLIAVILCMVMKAFRKDLEPAIAVMLPYVVKEGGLVSCVIHSVMLSLSSFNLLLTLTSALSTASSARIYHKCWFLKLLAYFSLLFTSLWTLSFYDFFIIIATPFAFIYIIIQSIYLIEFAYTWNDNWFDKYSEEGSKSWAFLLISTSLCSWVLILMLLAVSYIKSAYFPITLTCFLLSIVLTGVSSSSLCENGSLLSCSVTMLTSHYFLVTGLIWTEETNYLLLGTDLLISAIALIYFALEYNEASVKNGHQELSMTDMKGVGKAEESKIEENDVIERIEEEKYKKFQFALACGCFYFGVIVAGSQWGGWIKVGQAGVLAVCYIWTLLAPVVMQDREFSV